MSEEYIAMKQGIFSAWFNKVSANLSHASVQQQAEKDLSHGYSKDQSVQQQAKKHRFYGYEKDQAMMGILDICSCWPSHFCASFSASDLGGSNLCCEEVIKSLHKFLRWTAFNNFSLWQPVTEEIAEGCRAWQADMSGQIVYWYFRQTSFFSADPMASLFPFCFAWFQLSLFIISRRRCN